MVFYQRPQINLAPFKEEIRILPFRGTSNFQQYQSAELVSEIMVFPNPTADHFNLKVNNDSQLAIVTDSGTLMKSQELNRGVNVIDVSNLRSGVYFIVISSLTESQTSRIIIER